MTLRELLAVTPKAEWTQRVPSVLMVMDSDADMITEADLDEETSAAVYDNGYVIFQSGQWATVFPLHECRDYIYHGASEDSVVPYEEFADQPWQIRVFMEGDKRLFHNGNKRKEGRDFAYEEYGEDCRDMSDHGLGDALRIIIEREMEQEEIETLHRYMEMLTERQRAVLIQCVVRQRKQDDVADEMGISRQAVTDCLKRTLQRMREAYGITGEVKRTKRFSTH